MTSKKKAPKNKEPAEVIDISAPSKASKFPLTPPPKSIGEGFDVYMREVNRFPLLSPEDEFKLAEKAFRDRDTEAIQKLVSSNLRFVVKIAFEYSRYGAKLLDLIQEGNVGLVRAVQEFNPYKDVRLITYAVYWIRSYIQDYLLRNWSIVRVGTTAAQKKLFYNLKKEQERFEREGLTPQPRAIAMNLGVTEDEVKVMQERFAGGDTSLSSAPAGEDSSRSSLTLAHKIADESPLASNTLEETEQSVLFREALQEFEDELDEREKHIFHERLLSENPITLIEIGDRFGVSKERARQLEEKIKTKLKNFLDKYYPDISVS
jgi:RNA polymerase sigma-32 factor